MSTTSDLAFPRAFPRSLLRIPENTIRENRLELSGTEGMFELAPCSPECCQKRARAAPSVSEPRVRKREDCGERRGRFHKAAPPCVELMVPPAASDAPPSPVRGG